MNLLPKAVFEQHIIALGKTGAGKSSAIPRELWKAIPGFPHYQVSNLGRVRRIQISFPKPFMGTRGYFHVVLSENGKTVTKNIHSLVALAFKGARPKEHTCNHEDGDKTNNRTSNLKYRTPSYQLLHAMSLGLCKPPRGSANGKSILKDSSIREMRELRKQGLLHSEIAKKFGVASSTIRNILTGRRWRHIP